MLSRIVVLGLLLAAVAASLSAQPPAKDAKDAKDTATEKYVLKEGVVYGRKGTTDLTIDVFTPKQNANGRGVILCVSGGFQSNKKMLDVNRPVFIPPLIERGYTVFAVFHHSPPKSIPAAVEDIDAAVKFVKEHAKEYGIDRAKLGAVGMSAGGHLSLMQGSAPGEGKVAAVGVFCPVTDLSGFGKKAAADDEKALQLKRATSPVYRVSKDSAPALIFHGTADFIVPYKQSELIVAKYKEAGVPIELVPRKGASHGWGVPNMAKDAGQIADWFDKYLGVTK